MIFIKALLCDKKLISVIYIYLLYHIYAYLHVAFNLHGCFLYDFAKIMSRAKIRKNKPKSNILRRLRQNNTEMKLESSTQSTS